MSCRASLETEAVVDVAVPFCEALFQTKTLPLLVLDFTSPTYNNREILTFEGPSFSNICWATIFSWWLAPTGAERRQKIKKKTLSSQVSRSSNLLFSKVRTFFLSLILNVWLAWAGAARTKFKSTTRWSIPDAIYAPSRCLQIAPYS